MAGITVAGNCFPLSNAKMHCTGKTTELNPAYLWSSSVLFWNTQGSGFASVWLSKQIEATRRRSSQQWRELELEYSFTELLLTEGNTTSYAFHQNLQKKLLSTGKGFNWQSILQLLSKCSSGNCQRCGDTISDITAGVGAVIPCSNRVFSPALGDVGLYHSEKKFQPPRWRGATQ